jgi:Tol biopolymer transport system component
MSFTGPVVSKDGTTLFAVGVLEEGELVRYNVARREFAAFSPSISGSWLTFSPDGQAIAYVGYPDRILWRSRVDGSGKQRLVDGPFEADGSTWSPDGKWIAFRSRMSGRHLRIHLIPSVGGDPHPILTEDREQGIPTWSPDGTRLAFGDVPEIYERPSGGEVLHVYDLVRRAFDVIPGSRGLWTCRWSPEGHYLLALTIVGQKLRILDLTSGVWRPLPVDQVGSPTWSRDGRFVYYETLGNSHVLRRIRIADGRVEDLADLTDYATPRSGWMGLAPDDSPVVLRSLSTTEVYALRLDRR